MKNLTKLFLVFALILFVNLSLKAVSIDTTKFIGQWGGRIEFAERLEAINIIIQNYNHVLSGTLTLVYDKEDIPLAEISCKDSKIYFTSKYDKGKIVFNGKIVGDSLKGKIIMNTPHEHNVDIEGEFKLARGKLIEKDMLFLERLRTYADYENETINTKYKFSYMDSSNENLVNLKNKYNLDSVAGTGNGNELDKIINLMKWVHTVLPYNGQSGLIKPANSLYLLSCEQAKNTGINCLLKSIVLNDVYLAMGYPSRIVHCMPKGDNYIEDHYINMVYSKTSNKWIYIDPSVGAYMQDENGDLLSVQEVRQKLINGEKIVLNSDAILPPDLYFHYMSKNLFRFSCSFISEFNFESKDRKVYCNLYPKLYLDSESKKNAEIVVSNPDYFWAKPY
jgi:hypothetical protein